LAISQLNKQLEVLSYDLNKFENEKNLCELFVTKISSSIKSGDILFRDQQTVNLSFGGLLC